MTQHHWYSLWMQPGEDTPFCNSEHPCWSQTENRVWTCKHLLSLVAGLPGDTSGLMPGSWALGSRMKCNTSHFRWRPTVQSSILFYILATKIPLGMKNVPSHLIKIGRIDTCSTRMRDLISCTSCCLERGVWCSSILSHCSSMPRLQTPPMDKSTAKQRYMIRTIMHQRKEEEGGNNNHCIPSIKANGTNHWEVAHPVFMRSFFAILRPMNLAHTH